MHPAEKDEKLPEVIRNGHDIHCKHFCAVLGCEHAPYNLLQPYFKKIGDYVFPFPILCKVARTVIENNDDGIFTAPADGYFGFAANGFHTVDMYVQDINGAGDIYSRFTLSMPAEVSYTGSAVIPVSKGSRLIFGFDKVPSELWFIPTEGSR